MSATQNHHLRLTAKSAPTGVPSARGHARLLDMTYARLVFSVNAIPFVALPFLAWFYLLGNDPAALIAWTLGYVAAAVGIRLQRRRYQRDRGRLTDAAMIAQWLPVIHRIALVHGAALTGILWLTAGRASFEFALLLHISLAVIVTANAAHQTPIFGAFQRFFVACWGTSCALVPWTLPDHWEYGLPLALIHGVTIYRHGRTAHQFFVQHVMLGEDGVRLAERYRAAKEEAEQALREKNQFLATASHDLRQPVHAMGFLIESIVHRNQDASLVPALEDLRRSVRSVHMMFNSLLDLSKIESGVVSVHRSAVPIDPLLDEVATLFRGEADSRGVALRVRSTRGKAVVFADVSLLKQSLINLTHNALRYTQRGGVLLAARRRGSDWRLEVWDTGIGIASEDQARIYSPFYRNEHAWRADSAGHGLGLAVVARCADLIGATYGLSSRQGTGSHFWMRLPATDASDTAAVRSLRTGPASVPPSRLVLDGGSCLVIDDDPQVCAAWASLMQAWGVDVRCVATASDAFRVLSAGFSPRAILCDQRLRSGESGFDVLKELFVRCPEASGAMVSGEFDSPELRQAEREGYLVLQKPVEAAQLHALLSQWFQERRGAAC